MRVGIALPQYTIDAGWSEPWAACRAVAERAEALGIDSVWLSDHAFASGPDGARSGALEPIAAAAALIAATARLRIGTLVLAATMRSHALVAHAAATLPAGRFIAGIGAGWYAPEHRAFGVTLPPYATRVETLERTLGALRAAGVPAVAGGSGDAVISIAARHADGWNVAWDASPEAFAALNMRADRACEAAGRDPATLTRSIGVTVLVADDDPGIDDAVDQLRRRAPFLAGVGRDALAEKIVVGTPERCVERLRAYDADEVVVALLLRDDLEMLELFATAVAPALR